MAHRAPDTSTPPARPTLAAIGVPTSTRIAFLHDGVLYLERINVLAEDGAGVLCETEVPVGARVPVVFRLSTATAATRCSAEVLGDLPTTPAGLALRAEHGDAAPPVVPAGGVSDSATAIFRLEDLRPPPGLFPSGNATGNATGDAPAGVAKGFCLRFVDLDAAGRAALLHHLRTSKALADRLAAQGGRSEHQDRLAIAETFHEGDLSKRALDW